MFIDYRSEKKGYIDLRRTGSSQLRKDSPCGAAWRVKSCPGHKHGRASGTSWRRRETGHLVPKRAGGIIYTSKMDDLSVKKWLILFVPVIYVPSHMGDLLGYVLRDAFETTCLRYFLKCMCHICVSYTCTNCLPIDKVKLCEGCKTS